MREIKFRAWDKKSKKMRVVSNIVFDSYSEFSKNIKVKLVNLWGKIFPAYDDGECNTDILVQREGNTFVLMQFAGLKDKNGVEIYESDKIIVGENIGVVSFKDGLFLWGDELLCEYNNIGEVIGNIYENPELMQ